LRKSARKRPSEVTVKKRGDMWTEINVSAERLISHQQPHREKRDMMIFEGSQGGNRDVGKGGLFKGEERLLRKKGLKKKHKGGHFLQPGDQVNTNTSRERTVWFEAPFPEKEPRGTPKSAEKNFVESNSPTPEKRTGLKGQGVELLGRLLRE